MSGAAADRSILLLAMADSTRCWSCACRAAFCRARRQVHQPMHNKLTSALATTSRDQWTLTCTRALVSAGISVADTGAGWRGGVGGRFMAVSGIGTRQPSPCHAEMVSVRLALHVSR